ncbi:hypothetical protein D3C81_1282970 [compost metagenome]
MVQLEGRIRHLVGHDLAIEPAGLLAGNLTFFNDDDRQATLDKVDRGHETENASADDDHVCLLGQRSLGAFYKAKPWFAGDQATLARQHRGQDPRTRCSRHDATADQKFTPGHSHDTFLS